MKKDIWKVLTSLGRIQNIMSRPYKTYTDEIDVQCRIQNIMSRPYKTYTDKNDVHSRV